MNKDARRHAGARKRPVAMFLVKCVVYWGAALLLVSRVPAIEKAGVELTLGTLVAILKPFDASVVRAGSALHTSRAAIQIVPDCSPHMAFLIFAAVVLAFPSSWRQRGLGLLLGALVIHVFNTVRILALIWVLAWKGSWFEFAHVYLWQTGTVLIVFLTFALWIRTLGPRPRPA